jgi:hypothetical protein
MRMRRAFSGAEHPVADSGRSRQRLSIANPKHGSDVVPIRKSNQRKLGVLDSVTSGDVQPGAEPSAVKFESHSDPTPATRLIDSSL